MMARVRAQPSWPFLVGLAGLVLLGGGPGPLTAFTAPAAETSAAWLEPCYLLLQIWVCSNLSTLFGLKANFIYIVLS